MNSSNTKPSALRPHGILNIDSFTSANENCSIPKKKRVGPGLGQQQGRICPSNTPYTSVASVFRVYNVVSPGHYFIHAVELNFRKLRLSHKICFRVCFDNSIVRCRHWLPPLCCNSCWKSRFSQILVVCSSPETMDTFCCSNAFSIQNQALNILSSCRPVIHKISYVTNVVFHFHPKRFPAFFGF